MKQSKETSSRSEAPQIVTVTEIRDTSGTRDTEGLLDQDFVRLDSEEWSARRVIVRLENCVVIHHQTNRRVRSRTTLPENLMSFVALGPRSRGAIDGLIMKPNLLLVTEPGAVAELVVEAGYRSVAILISPDALAHHLKTRGRFDEFRMPDGVELLKVGSRGCARFFRQGKRLADTAVSKQALVEGSPRFRAVALSDLIETLLSIVATPDTPEIAQQSPTAQSHSRIVKQAQLHAAGTDPSRLYVGDLCRAAGASERTLQYAFQRIMGMTPMAYLRLLRLHRVREALTEAPPGSTTVSGVALDWGFTHFGEFSRVYRESFGELPSETLRSHAIRGS